jgi:transposase-like protein
MTILSCFHDESSAYRFTERVAWKDGPICPHCGEGGRFGQLHGDTTSVGTWKCYGCRRLFSVRHKTPLYKSHLPVHVWLQAIYLIAATDSQIGACRLASVLGISFRSAVHMRCKVQLAIEARSEPPLDRDDGDIEALTRSAIWQAGASDEDVQSGWCVARFDRFKAAVDASTEPGTSARFIGMIEAVVGPISNGEAPAAEVEEPKRRRLARFSYGMPLPMRAYLRRPARGSIRPERRP